MLLLGVGGGLTFPALMTLAMSGVAPRGLRPRLRPGQHDPAGRRRARPRVLASVASERHRRRDRSAALRQRLPTWRSPSRGVRGRRVRGRRGRAAPRTPRAGRRGRGGRRSRPSVAVAPVRRRRIPAASRRGPANRAPRSGGLAFTVQRDRLQLSLRVARGQRPGRFSAAFAGHVVGGWPFVTRIPVCRCPAPSGSRQRTREGFRRASPSLAGRPASVDLHNLWL